MRAKYDIWRDILWFVSFDLALQSFSLIFIISDVHCVGWASISGTLLIGSPDDGGPGLSRDYVHVSRQLLLLLD